MVVSNIIISNLCYQFSVTFFWLFGTLNKHGGICILTAGVEHDFNYTKQLNQRLCKRYRIILVCIQLIWQAKFNDKSEFCEPAMIFVMDQLHHYIDVIMTKMASQITSLTVLYSIVYSGADQRKHIISASLAFVRGIHRDRWIPRTKGQ